MVDKFRDCRAGSPEISRLLSASVEAARGPMVLVLRTLFVDSIASSAISEACSAYVRGVRWPLIRRVNTSSRGSSHRLSMPARLREEVRSSTSDVHAGEFRLASHPLFIPGDFPFDDSTSTLRPRRWPGSYFALGRDPARHSAPSSSPRRCSSRNLEIAVIQYQPWGDGTLREKKFSHASPPIRSFDFDRVRPLQRARISRDHV